jgi:hypothetical protein
MTPPCLIIGLQEALVKTQFFPTPNPQSGGPGFDFGVYSPKGLASPWLKSPLPFVLGHYVWQLS